MVGPGETAVRPERYPSGSRELPEVAAATCTLPVPGGGVTQAMANWTVAACPELIVTARGLAPEIVQLGASPLSRRECDPAGTLPIVRVPLVAIP